MRLDELVELEGGANPKILTCSLNVGRAYVELRWLDAELGFGGVVPRLLLPADFGFAGISTALPFGTGAAKLCEGAGDEVGTAARLCFSRTSP